VAFEDAPGEQIDKRLEEIAHKEFGVLEDARGLALARSLTLPRNTVMCQERMIPVSSSSDHSGSRPGRRVWG